MTKDQVRSTEEALDLALEALEYPGPSWIEARQPAITAIKQARSAPVQEPVYHLRQYGDVTKEQLDRYFETGDINPQPAPYVATPLAAQRQSAPDPKDRRSTWVGLTDEEILKLAYPIRWQEVDDFEADKAVNFAQTIEAKLKEKNS
jgi:hypothetical protein